MEDEMEKKKGKSLTEAIAIAFEITSNRFLSKYIKSIPMKASQIKRIIILIKAEPFNMPEKHFTDKQLKSIFTFRRNLIISLFLLCL